jgi:hypothetical protein
LIELKIAKHRNGTLGKVKLKANLSIQKFTDWEETELQGWKPVSSFSESFK